MSWLVNSLANSLKLDDNDDNKNDDQHHNTSRPTDSDSASLTPSDQTTPRHGGVKDDLSEFSKIFTKQLWGVAAFLAPPPPDAAISTDGAIDREDSARIAGICNDLSEIGSKLCESN